MLLTSFAAGNLDARSCTTMMWFLEGIGPKRSTATVSQHRCGTGWCPRGSEVFFSVKELHKRQVERNVLTLESMLWKKKCVRSLLSMLDWAGWLPRCASSMTFW